MRKLGSFDPDEVFGPKPRDPNLTERLKALGARLGRVSSITPEERRSTALRERSVIGEPKSLEDEISELERRIESRRSEHDFEFQSQGLGRRMPVPEEWEERLRQLRSERARRKKLGN